jgi:hypothetical protein
MSSYNYTNACGKLRRLAYFELLQGRRHDRRAIPYALELLELGVCC